jgi:hypothetical protein
MVNIGRPPLPPNRPYHWPLNYFEYVKDFDLDAHVKVFKVTIKANSEINYARLLIYLVLPSEILCLTSVGCLHTTRALYGCHNGSFSCIP